MEWTNDQKKYVWRNAQKIAGYNPSIWRKDCCGAWMKWDEYGNDKSIYGWEIDHIYPQKLMERNNIPEDEMHDYRNLRAMQHSNNESKGDDYPDYKSVITADGNRNIESDRHLTVNKNVQKRIKSLYGWYLLDDDDIDY